MLYNIYMYRAYIYPIVTLIILGSFFTLPANALTIKKPLASFGGRVILTQVPGVTCTGQYWLTTKPSGGFPINTPLVIEATNKTISPGANILGLVNPVSDMNTCFIPTPTGPIYIPSWRIDTTHMGVSTIRPKLR